MKALVFSAGGAFGAYQAGAWQALEERGFRPDIVVGASIGAVNATAVARGASAGRLQQWWRDPHSNVFRFNWPPKQWAFLDSRPVLARLEDFLREFPHLPGGARLFVTVTELPTTKTRTVRDEQVTAPALLASCAIPFVYAPVRLHGHWCTDGGVFCRLPIRVAAEAGATEIIAVDLLARPPSILLRHLLGAVIGVRRMLRIEPDLMAAPAEIRQWRLQPERRLGLLRDTARWDLSRIDRWIEAGYRDTLAAFDREGRQIQASTAHASSPVAESAAPT